MVCNTTTNSCPEITHMNDICWLHKRRGAPIFDDNEKFYIFTNNLVSNGYFEFPCRQIGRRNRNFSLSWLKEYKWLAYSQKEDSAYCKVCIFFAPDEVTMSNSQSSGKLVRGRFCS